jgi:hypothetical protein
MIRSLLSSNEEDVPYMWVPLNINMRYLWPKQKPKETKNASTQTEADLTDYIIVKYYKGGSDVTKNE